METYLKKTAHAITYLRRVFGNTSQVKMLALIAGFIISSIATGSGLVALMVGGGEFSFFKLSFAALVTAFVQFMLIFSAKNWWKTRSYSPLILYLVCMFFSVTMALAAYLDFLSLDNLHTQNIYQERLHEMIDSAAKPTNDYKRMAEKTQEMAEYSAAMALAEQNEGGTCDVVEIGRGPRTLLREHDQEKFEYYAKVFKTKNSKLTGIRDTIARDYSRYSGNQQVVYLNREIAKINVIATDNADLNQYKRWLGRRVSKDGYQLNTGVANFSQQWIRCPDERINNHYEYMHSLSFSKINLFNGIADPDVSGTQVIQAIDTMLKLLPLQSRKISLEEWVALLLAILIDLSILFLANSPKSLPPCGGSSWEPYWAGAGNVNPAIERLCMYTSYRGRNINFFIPTDDTEFIPLFVPLMAHGGIKHKKTIDGWKIKFCIPKRIRKQFSQCESFEHYRCSVNCAAKWVIDSHPMLHSMLKDRDVLFVTEDGEDIIDLLEEPTQH